MPKVSGTALNAAFSWRVSKIKVRRDVSTLSISSDEPNNRRAVWHSGPVEVLGTISNFVPVERAMFILRSVKIMNVQPEQLYTSLTSQPLVPIEYINVRSENRLFRCRRHANYLHSNRSENRDDSIPVHVDCVTLIEKVALRSIRTVPSGCPNKRDILSVHRAEHFDCHFASETIPWNVLPREVSFPSKKTFWKCSSPYSMLVFTWRFFLRSQT